MRALKALLGVAVVAAVIARVGTGAVLDGVRAVSPGAVVAALALGAVSTVASAARWCLVARGTGLAIGFGGAIGDCYRAQFLNSVLPAGVLGDVHRAVDHGRRAGDLGGGVRAVVLERVAGQIVVIVVGLALLLATPSPAREQLAGFGPTALAAGAIGLGALGLTAAPAVRRRLTPWVGAIRDGLLTARTGPGVLALSLVSMAAHLALLHLAAGVVGVGASPGELLPLLVVPLLAMGLPVNVGGWGPREATTAVTFGIAGLGAQTGLATSVAFGVLALVSTLPGLGVLVLRRALPRAGAPRITLRARRASVA